MRAALVPAKSFATAKSRLAPVLAPDERRALATAMCRHVLRTLRATALLDEVLVVSDGEDARSLADDLGCSTLRDPPGAPLARIVDAGLETLFSRGAQRCLVVLADLPRLDELDVSGMLTALDDAEVVLAPDRARRGTNALGLRAPRPTCFGHDDSFARHLAATSGMRVALWEGRGTAFDVDLPEDLG